MSLTYYNSSGGSGSGYGDDLVYGSSASKVSAEVAAAISAATQDKACEISDEIYLFDHIVVGMHVQLKCGCRGFISNKSEPSPDGPSMRYFQFTFTDNKCQGMGDIIRHYYAEGGVHAFMSDVYSESTFSKWFPVKLCAPPTWFPNLQTPPENANKKRGVHVRITSPAGQEVDMVVPCADNKLSSYQMVSLLRDMFYDKCREGSVPVVQIIDLEIRGKIDSKTCMEYVSKLKTPSILELNTMSLFDSIMAAIISDPISGIEINEPVPLTRKDCVAMLEKLVEHPFWRNRQAIISLKDEGVVRVTNKKIV